MMAIFECSRFLLFWLNSFNCSGEILQSGSLGSSLANRAWLNVGHPCKWGLETLWQFVFEPPRVELEECRACSFKAGLLWDSSGRAESLFSQRRWRGRCVSVFWDWLKILALQDIFLCLFQFFVLCWDRMWPDGVSKQNYWSASSL